MNAKSAATDIELVPIDTAPIDCRESPWLRKLPWIRQLIQPFAKSIFTTIKIDEKAAINDFCYAWLERYSCRCWQILVWKRLHLFCILSYKQLKSKDHQMPNDVSLMLSAEGLTALADMALAPRTSPTWTISWQEMLKESFPRTSRGNSTSC